MLKIQLFFLGGGDIFLLDDKENVSSFQTAQNTWTKMKFRDFSTTSTISPKIKDFSGLGKCINQGLFQAWKMHFQVL